MCLRLACHGFGQRFRLCLGFDGFGFGLGLFSHLALVLCLGALSFHFGLAFSLAFGGTLLGGSGTLGLSLHGIAHEIPHDHIGIAPGEVQMTKEIHAVREGRPLGPMATCFHRSCDPCRAVDRPG